MLCGLVMSCIAHQYVPFRDLFTLAIIGPSPRASICKSQRSPGDACVVSGGFSVNTFWFKLMERVGTLGPKAVQAALKQRKATTAAAKEAADAFDMRISEQFREARRRE